jgi:hypothetical protein
MEYTILTARSTKELIERVTAYLKAGWQLVGGVAIMTEGSFYEYAQAMVRY